MKRPIPIVSTIVVVLAVALMVTLGFWQLGRMHQKEAAIAAYEANIKAPATAYPALNPTDESYLFRTVSAQCLRVIRWQVIGGRTWNDRVGWRHIAHCATGAEGPGLLVDMGLTAKPDGQVNWTGGMVRGRATYEPDAYSFIVRLAGKAPPLQLMIVSDTAAPGLTRSAPPNPVNVPNNHLSYAVQWFLFAGIALVIYGLTLRKRWREGR